MNIDFKSQLELLHELQQIDLDLHRVSSELEDLPKKLSAVESNLLDVQGEQEKLKIEFSEVEKLRRTTELELNDAISRLKDREARLYAIKTTKEYQAAIKEVAETKRLNKEREERILSSMEKLEGFKVKISELDKSFSEAKKLLDEAKKEVLKQMEELNASVAHDKLRRQELMGKVAKEVMRKYEFVRQRYADALAAVDGGVCQGCHMNIPPQLYNEILRMSEFKFCPNCRRMIYPKSLFEEKS